MSIRYLSAADIYSINEAVVGHRPYVRDRHLLRSAARRPTLAMFGEEQFPTLHEKAAALLHGLAYHHLFGDGNKRTAQRAVVRFLEDNGCQIAWDQQEAAAFILEIAQGKQSIEAISAWLQNHTITP